MVRLDTLVAKVLQDARERMEKAGGADAARSVARREEARGKGRATRRGAPCQQIRRQRRHVALRPP